MKLSIERVALLKSLAHVQNVVERRSTIPILSNVKLRASGDGLMLAATDMDLSVEAHQPARIAEPGETTVAAHTLFDIIRKMPDGSEVTLEVTPPREGMSGVELSVRAGRSVFNLPCLPADEFPAMPADDLGVRFEIPAADLRKLVDKTKFAVSTEETRYYLNGVHVHAHNDGATSMLRGVATDGHRLARVEVALPAGAGSIPAIIIPRKTVGELRKLIEDLDGHVTVGVSDKLVQFLLEGAVLVSRLIEGTFPDYERVIPSGNETVARLESKGFADAVDRVATISTERARAVKLHFQDGQVTLSAVSAESGRAVEELDGSLEGKPLEIGFNARYVLDILGEIEGDEVTFEMSNPAAPTLVRDPADGSTLYVLMPMRV
ncbi:MAG: DNA polymerase III subunit beta [Geminicoccaceae bacterium]|nr:DNA polymerase III subunit beta [Geminicoccaceae bacterium]MCB9944869.1 DNA polymerase III subunit beta [Geminicoccaceae bacterium]